jgi:dGTPase
MIRNRKKIEELEKKNLEDYAVKSTESKGREFSEKEADDRTCFQRDCDRISYSKTSLRLKGKTQVVLAGHGDHYHTRESHTKNVVTVARRIARSLGLNEDLVEAIALGHDLGHTPFGHEGESALNEMMKEYGDNFEHNEQSLWIVEKLERRSEKYNGLNLTFEVRDGLDKHRTIYDSPESKDSAMPSLEAQVVNIADEIAYKFHDLADGLRDEAFTLDDLEELAIWRTAKQAIEEYESKLVDNIRSKIMGLMISDLINTSDTNIQEANVHSVEDVYKCREQLIGFSDDMKGMVDELGDFLHEKFYRSEKVIKYNKKGKEIIKFLFRKLYDEPELMPDDFHKHLKSEEKHVVVKDYIAGMTDNFAIELYNRLNQ